MPKLLRFFLFLVAFSLLLFWLWMEWGQEAYLIFLTRYFTFPLAQETGGLPVLMSEREQLNLFLGRLHYVKSHYMNLVPFLSLILAVPGLGWKKRLFGLAAGGLLLVAWHVLFTLGLNHFQAKWGGPTREFFRLYIPAVSVNSAVPVIIWALVAWKGVKELVGEIFVRPPSSEAGQRIA